MENGHLQTRFCEENLKKLASFSLQKNRSRERTITTFKQIKNCCKNKLFSSYMVNMKKTQ